MTYTLETRTVTPHQAREWLNTAPKHQRKVNNAYAQRLADAMLAGTFNQSPQPFIIDSNGDLLDGQHRATAICIADTPLESAVVIHGVDPELFGVIDVQQRRHAAQFVRHPQASVITSAARHIMVYRKDRQMRDLHKAMERFPLADIVAMVEEVPYLAMQAGACTLIRNATRINAPTLLAVTTLGSENSADQVEDWLNGLNSGSDLTVGDPRLTLRNTWITRENLLRHDPRRRWAFVVKAWNAWVNEEDLRVLRFRMTSRADQLRTGDRGEVMPEVM